MAEFERGSQRPRTSLHRVSREAQSVRCTFSIEPSCTLLRIRARGHLEIVTLPALPHLLFFHHKFATKNLSLSQIPSRAGARDQSLHLHTFPHTTRLPFRIPTPSPTGTLRPYRAAGTILRTLSTPSSRTAARWQPELHVTVVLQCHDSSCRKWLFLCRPSRSQTLRLW